MAILLCLSIFTISFTIHHRVPSHKAANAVVYIYRVGQLTGALANWAIFSDGQKICMLSNNKYLKVEVQPGKHVYNAHVGGAALFKKETEVEINAEEGQNYYIACNVKTSLTRQRLELIEVTKGTAEKQMEKMQLDKCQEVK